MIVLSRAGKLQLLNEKRTFLNTCTLRLFQNNLQPTDANVVADFTEATFDGYAAQPLDDFGVAALDQNNKGRIVAPLHTFTATGGVTANQIYGYYVTDPAGALVYSDRNAAAPVTVSGDGSAYTVVPAFLEDSMP